MTDHQRGGTHYKIFSLGGAYDVWFPITQLSVVKYCDTATLSTIQLQQCNVVAYQLRALSAQMSIVVILKYSLPVLCFKIQHALCSALLCSERERERQRESVISLSHFPVRDQDQRGGLNGEPIRCSNMTFV